ncbi:MAG: glycoside hydrolase family 130 protein [Chitinophagaceae bacterium]
MKIFRLTVAGSLLALGLLNSCHNSSSSKGVAVQGADTATFPVWAMQPFVKVDSVNPVLTPSDSGIFLCPILHQEVAWQAKDVFNPAAIVRNGKLDLLYRAQDKLDIIKGGTSRIGLAESNDGLHFTRRSSPVFFPAQDFMKYYEWPGGTEDPRIAESADGTYIMTYTGWNGDTARLCLATSHDLIHWEKQGLVIGQAYGGKYKNLWSKSGAILTYLDNGKLIAKKINGKYWMYWGDSNIYLAQSEDLIHWTPLEDTSGKLQILLAPRPGFFDSRLVEAGPSPIYTKSGILFIYNSMNLAKGGDSTLPAGAYSAGQVWIDPKDPTRVMDRTNHNFIHPDKPYELSGQVNKVCFVEGLAPFHGNWYLYYGTADSRIAVAIYHPAPGGLF